MTQANWIEYVEFSAKDALAIAPCPSCGDFWYSDLDETGVPYTCYACCNGTYAYRQYEADAFATSPVEVFDFYHS